MLASKTKNIKILNVSPFADLIKYSKMENVLDHHALGILIGIEINSHAYATIRRNMSLMGNVRNVQKINNGISQPNLANVKKINIRSMVSVSLVVFTKDIMKMMGYVNAIMGSIEIKGQSSVVRVATLVVGDAVGLIKGNAYNAQILATHLIMAIV